MEKLLTDGKFNLAAFPFCGGRVTFAINSNFVVCGLKLKQFWVNVVSLCFSRCGQFVFFPFFLACSSPPLSLGASGFRRVF